MKYIAHRGLWRNKSEQNTFLGIKRALDLGFGIELDVRDKNGKLIVSHDPSFSLEVLLLQEILELAKGYGSVLAINVKSDGILTNLKSALAGFEGDRFFLFDMSIPETIGYLKSGLPTYMRLSEYESYCELHQNSDGIWLDAFKTDWWVGATEIFRSEKNICVVSPELHGRDELEAWRFLKRLDSNSNLYICTDHPERAKEFFG